MSEDGGGVAVADNNVYGRDVAVEDAQKLKDTGYAIQGGTVNGVYDNGTVTLNINSPKTLNSVVDHEVVHAMEGSDFYAPLRDAVVAYAKKPANTTPA